ncbi:hypothetical protein RJD24_02705 [Bacillaceae bacterium IKA-2]|jgi:ssDNA-binding Zn-finger/Zn-ribbon topoisomerase 1|nr:hypothetical protein RJD24_02705 [Bacillaceae bacterium IKA-2]
MLGILLGKNRSKNANYAICPNCEKKISIKLWDEQTRAFLGANIPSIVNGGNTKIPYQCPECYSGYLSKHIKFVD